MSELSDKSVKELFAIALGALLSEVEWREVFDEHFQPHKHGIFKIYPWDALDELQKRATRKIYRKARKLCRSKHPNEREVGVSILASFGGWDGRIYRKRRLHLLLKLIDVESDPGVLGALINGLGHFHNEKANQAILDFQSHENAQVRLAVAMTLSVWVAEYEYTKLTDVLIALSTDSAACVRDWATYRLGNLELDSLTIREALYARLSDPDDNPRGEALVGLARRKDQRVFDPLLAELEHMHPDGYLPLNAAEILADERLLPSLRKIQATGEVWHRNDIQNAIAACERQQNET